jgi:tyrosine-protein phosphatase SIW14
MIPNVSQVDTDNIWRGGQPDDEGWNLLKSMGITHVIKLNEESEGTDIAAQALGMAVLSFPINLLEQVLTEPTKRTIFDAVNQITENTFVHCEHGEDRTGLVVAAWRVMFRHWAKEDAEDEMLEHGFHKLLLGLWEYWQHEVNSL